MKHPTPEIEAACLLADLRERVGLETRELLAGTFVRVRESDSIYFLKVPSEELVSYIDQFCRRHGAKSPPEPTLISLVGELRREGKSRGHASESPRRAGGESRPIPS